MLPNQLLADSIDSTNSNSTQNYLPKLDYPQPRDLPLNSLAEKCSGVLVVLVVLLADDSVGILAGDAEEVVAAVVEVADAVLAVVA